MSQATNTATPPKIALVTGAGSGIGKGCATALLNDGWTVVFTGRRIETLHAAIAAAGPDAAAARLRRECLRDATGCVRSCRGPRARARFAARVGHRDDGALGT